MIVNQLPSAKRQHPSRYHALAILINLLLVVALQPLVIKADLNGVEACENRCFNRSECDGVGSGICCQWDDDIGQCISSIGHDICPGTTTMSLPPLGSTPITNCPSTDMSLVESTSSRRNLSNNQAESAPSSSPTTYDDSRCMNIETSLDWYLCIAGVTIPQLKTMIITQKISAVLSILGSSHIIQDVLRDPKKQNESPYHRIMLGLSCSDIIFSFCCFLSSWVMPRGMQIYAVGSNATCSVTGFFVIIGFVSTLLYSCSLATFYLLKLKYNWVNSKVKAIEKWLLFLPCTLGLIVAIVSAAMSKLGPWGYGCS